MQADLEYHEELLPEAKQDFFAAAQEILNKLPPDIQKELQSKRDQAILDKAPKEDEDEDYPEDVDEENEEMDLEARDIEGVDAVAEQSESEAAPAKDSDLKKLYRKIAAETHPDKSAAKGLGKAGTKIAENIFKKAKEAYKDKNWYLLYSLALDLGLEVDDPTKEHLEWLEEDINSCQSKVKHLSQLIVWVWFTGDEMTKKMAIQNYFQQVYDYSIDI